jgi:TRAP transporter TAXI family solute receptor
MDSFSKEVSTGTVSDYSRGRRFRVLIPVIIALVVIIAGLWAVIASLRPLPPRIVTMATGPEGGAYYEMGKRYRELLANQGVKLQLLSTAGGIENLARLRDPHSGVDVGFLQGGITSVKESPDLESLGAVFYEPLWFFYRSSKTEKRLAFLRGRKVSIGPEGSGTRALALELLARNGIDQNFAHLLSLAPSEAGEKLLRGEIDAALMLTSWDSPVVQRLLSGKNIELASFPRTDAYVALYPFLNKLTVPAGVADLAKNRPPADVVLFAPKASLVVRKDLHPALQYLLLDAAEQIHSGPGVFQKSGQFPAAESIDFPLSDEARQFYKSGRPFLQRHLPFWLAVLIDRLLILLIPLIGVIYPLVRFTPALYAFEIQRRIFKLYGELRRFEKDLNTRSAGQSIGDLNEWIDRLEEKANRLKVPLFYSNQLYTLRMHITMVRERLRRWEDTPNANR